MEEEEDGQTEHGDTPGSCQDVTKASPAYLTDPVGTGHRCPEDGVQREDGGAGRGRDQGAEAPKD